MDSRRTRNGVALLILCGGLLNYWYWSAPRTLDLVWDAAFTHDDSWLRENCPELRARMKTEKVTAFAPTQAALKACDVAARTADRR